MSEQGFKVGDKVRWRDSTFAVCRVLDDDSNAPVCELTDHRWEPGLGYRHVAYVRGGDLLHVLTVESLQSRLVEIAKSWRRYAENQSATAMERDVYLACASRLECEAAL